MKEFGFPKTEKLKQKKDLDLLFSKGKWMTHGSLRIISIKIEDTESPCPKVGVSVSKKFFKKAVHRNRIKRLLREVYRLNKTQFIEAFGVNSHNMLFWVSKNIPSHYNEVEAFFKEACLLKINSKKKQTANQATKPPLKP